jgi:RHS repeat-associated protein
MIQATTSAVSPAVDTSTALDPTPLPSPPVFSAQPTTEEITKARILAEPLIPTGTPSAEENAALASALSAYQSAYQNGVDVENTQDLETFVAMYPASPWRGALLMNLGLVYKHRGYFSRALQAWEAAWSALKGATEPRAVALADGAVGELGELSARLGRAARLEALLAETEGRDIRGSATERFASMRQGLGMMRSHPDRAFRCGPMAVGTILRLMRPGEPRDPRITEASSTPEGTSLLFVQQLASQVGLAVQMAKREAAVEPLLPAVVHWKSGHFAALIKRDGNFFMAHDPTFGGEFWVSQAALNEEASGYFVVPAGGLPPGWRAVSDSEGEGVWGKGYTTSNNPQNYKPNDTMRGGSATSGARKCPMAQYSVHAMLVSLHVEDTPLGYTPPRGPAVNFTVSYNQRDGAQPYNPSVFNLGPKWTFNWLAYIQDDPSNLSEPVTLYVRGGGLETYSGMSDTQTQSTPHYQTFARVTRVMAVGGPPNQTNVESYERDLPDGSKEIYSVVMGGSPRKFFLSKEIDPAGNEVQLTYIGYLGLLVGIQDAVGQRWSIEYAGGSTRIAKVTDPFGRTATFTYNSSGRLESVTDAIGIVSRFAYGASDFISSLTTPYGQTTFTTGEGGDQQRWIQATDPLGGTERVEFRQHGEGVLLAEPDGSPGQPPSKVPEGMPTNNAYLDARNTFFWSKLQYARYGADYTKAEIIHWLHDVLVDVNNPVASGVVESHKQPLENRVWYFYQGQFELGFLRDTTIAAPTHIGRRLVDGGATQMYRYEYNSRGLKTKEIDALGRETRFTYGTGSTPDPDQANGTGIDRLKTEQKNGAVYEVLESRTYDAQHRPLTVTDAAGQTTTYTYNAQGQVETATTPPRAGITENRTTTYSYDPNGMLQSVTGPATGATTTYTYDGFGRLRTSTDSDSYTITYDYDALDRPTKTTYPDGTFEEVVYNRLDAEKRRDRLGRWTHTFHDALRRAVAVRDPAGRTTTMQWCSCGSLDKVVDPNNNTTTWERDTQGRVTREIRADSSAWEYTYEATTSRLQKIKDPKQQEIRYSYFADDALQQVAYVNAQYVTPNVSFVYDTAFPRLISTADGTGTTTFAYHPIGSTPSLGAGRLATVDGPNASDTITYGHDELGRVGSRSVNGAAVTWSYDALGRIVGEGGPIGAFGYTYAGTTNRLQTVTYPNGQSSTYTYFNTAGDKQLQVIDHRANGGAPISRFTYSYDAAGDIKQWTQQSGTAAANAYDLGYDLAGQLTSAVLRTTDPTPVILKRYAYGYDPSGNRTTEQIDDAPTAFVFSNLNRLVSQDGGGSLTFKGTVGEPSIVTVQGKPATVGGDNRFEGRAQVGTGTSNVAVVATDPSGNTRTNTYQVNVSAAAKSYTYDANGNVTDDGARTYEWDAENRLLAVNLGAARSEFLYDGRGHRVRIIEKSNGSVITDRRLLWCGSDVCEERDAGTETLTKTFFASGAQIAGVSYFYTKDHLGSLRELTDSASTVRARYDYDPYGRRTKVSGDLESDLGFGGQWFHVPTGLHLATYRGYDSSVGRWLSEDPAHDDLNLYRFGYDDPVGYADPDGRAAASGSGKKPPPSSPPPPTPSAPSPKPKGPPIQIFHRPGYQLQKIYVMCFEDEKLVFWDFMTENPNTGSGAAAFSKWRNAFIDECYNSQPKGKDYRARTRIANPSMLTQGFGTSMGLGCCCEKCEK